MPSTGGSATPAISIITDKNASSSSAKPTELAAALEFTSQGGRSRPRLPGRLSGLPNVLKLNLRKGSNRIAVPADSTAEPLGLLCVRVIAARNLISKDRNGKSDPYLSLRVGESRGESEYIKASLNPIWGKLEGIGTNLDQFDGSSDKEAVCVAPVWAETLERTRIEVVAWDKDSFKRSEYLGEISLGIEDWIDTSGAEIPVNYSESTNNPVWTSISTSRKSKVSGELLIKIGWLGNPSSTALSKQPSPGKSYKNDNGSKSSNSSAQTAAALIAASSAREYAKDNPLNPEQEVQIREALSAAVLNKKLSMFGMLDREPGMQQTIASIKSNRASMASELVFTAPPSEGVGTIRIGDRAHGALSNELTTGAGDYDSDSSSASGLDAEVELNGREDDEMSASSEASSMSMMEDISEIDEGNEGEPVDYFDTALGMSDAPTAIPAHMSDANDLLRPQVLASISQPSTPGGTKRRIPLPGFLRRSSTAGKSAESLPHGGLNPQNLSQDVTLSADSAPDTASGSAAGTPGQAYRRTKYTRRKVKVGADDSEAVGGVDVDGKSKKKKKKHKRKKSQTGKRRKSSEDSPVQGPGGYSLSTGATSQDFLGVVFIEVKGAKNLPRWRNMIRTGWDMDPFCIVSFGKKVFRTRVIRHSRSPVWDEKLFFHIKRHEHAFQIMFQLFDWDKMSSNDFVGEAPLLLQDLTETAPKPNDYNGVYPVTKDGKIVGDELRDFYITLGSRSAELEETPKEQPTVHIRAKFTPYSALRQRFWRTYLKQYDTDDSENWSYVELYSLLDSLGSTLTRATIESFFTRFDKSPDETLTVEEAIVCLEDELTKPRSEKRAVESSMDTFNRDSQSGSITPGLASSALDLSDNSGGAGMTFTGQPLTGEPAEGVDAKDTLASGPDTLAPPQPSGRASTSSMSGASSNAGNPSRQSSLAISDAGDISGGPGASHAELERLINIKTCPLCHKKLTKKAEVDLVSHLAVCASQDWSSLSSLTVANFVSTSQAHRKWFTKLVNKVSNGAYKLGADSANILVQNRMTGQLQEEKMQAYVRIGIRLWYRAAGSSSRMEANRIKKLLRSMSVKQGIKFDAPESAAEIPRFIAFHRLDVNEILDPIASFENFNSFFYRKLKPEARPTDDPEDPTTLVSSADCRMTCFQSITEATNLWIKGRSFSIKRLLGKELEHEASKYEGGSLCIFRLAPQDYHRYHSPVDGKVGKMSKIPGEYYTVNPIAIRSGLDVYAENARVIVPMDSPAFGRVMNVCIGAMMVGTIRFTKEEGDEVKRNEEYGYFAFGGSTIVCLFEPNTVQFDEDLVANSRACIETLVRVGMRIGKRI